MLLFITIFLGIMAVAECLALFYNFKTANFKNTIDIMNKQMNLKNEELNRILKLNTENRDAAKQWMSRCIELERELKKLQCREKNEEKK